MVSDVGGLPEVVINHETGIVVQEKTLKKRASFGKTSLDPSLLIEMGVSGKIHVQEAYNWDACCENYGTSF